MGCTWTLQDILGRVAQRVSGRAYRQVGRSLMQLVGELLMGMLLTEEVPAYNLYALFRLNDDVLALADFATRADVTGMEVRRSAVPILLAKLSAPKGAYSAETLMSDVGLVSGSVRL